MLEETVIKGSEKGYGLVVKDLATVKVEAGNINSNKLGGVNVLRGGVMEMVGESKCIIQSAPLA